MCRVQALGLTVKVLGLGPEVGCCRLVDGLHPTYLEGHGYLVSRLTSRIARVTI